MDINLKHADIRLGLGHTLQVFDGIGTRVTCRSGRVWITQERDQRDVLLGAGEAFTLDRSGLAILQAIESTQIGLDEPTRAAHLRN